MIFVKVSFIVNGSVSLVLIDKRATSNMKTSLYNRNIKILETTDCSNTYDAIKYHPDISVCK